MTENLIETVQKVIQDVVAPDVREIKVRLASFEKDTGQRFEALQKQIDANLAIVLSAIGEPKAQTELP